ncbi:MAG: prepilin-type N-terminal cleavage/methylation domain-containing protein [Planctomycetes bacterium]|nr:prepilin-type N-terminal cleavage/methylation domain-containing protein [Planctomycetota bacterium]
MPDHRLPGGSWKPDRRAGFTLMELLIVIGIIIMLTAMSFGMLSGFLRGSTVKQAGRILQGQFFKARQLAASQRMYHFMRIETSIERASTIRIYADTNLNRTFNPPNIVIATEVLNAANPDNVVGDVVPLPRGCYIGAGVAGSAALSDPVTDLPQPGDYILQPGNPAPGAANPTQVIDYAFLPDGTCRRIGTNDRQFAPPAANTPYANFSGQQADVVIVQEDGRSRLLVDVNPMGGKIQKMIFQVAAGAAPFYTP